MGNNEDLLGPIGLMVARGKLAPSVSIFRKFGANPTVGATEELVGQTGAASPYMPTTAQAVEIVSGDAADTAAGSGARTVTVIGLDANWLEVSETVTLNGTNAVALTTAFIRIYRAFVATCGTYSGNNTGLLTVRVASAGTTFVVIAVGAGQTQTSHYTVPANKRLYVFDAHLFSESTKPASFYCWQRQNADTVTAPFAAKRLVNDFLGIDGSDNLDYAEPLDFPPKTDIWFGAQAAQSAKVSVEYSGYLVTV